jgi:TRAP-type C4-dicarboxylate transport system permease small subunit
LAGDASCLMSPTKPSLVDIILAETPTIIAAALLMVAVGVNFANVIGRYLFSVSIFWAEEAMIFLVIWAVFLGAIAVTFRGEHLSVDILSAALPQSVQPVLSIVIGSVCFFLFLYMSWQASLVMTILARNDQRSIALDIPMAIPQAALLVGFGASAIALLVRMAMWRRITAKRTAEDLADSAT